LSIAVFLAHFLTLVAAFHLFYLPIVELLLRLATFIHLLLLLFKLLLLLLLLVFVVIHSCYRLLYILKFIYLIRSLPQ